MSEEYTDVRNEGFAGANEPGEAKLSQGRPRIRRHIPKAEKISPYANAGSRSESGTVFHESNYQREGAYKPQRRSYNADYQHQGRERSSRDGSFRGRAQQDMPYSPRMTGGRTPQSGQGPQERFGGRYQGADKGNTYSRKPAGNYQRSPQRPYGGQAGGYNKPANDEKYAGNRPEGGSYNRQGAPQRKLMGKRPVGPNRPRRSFDPLENFAPKPILRYKEQEFDPDMPVRLNKFMANAGICSRREADKYIEAGLVTVNGLVVTELGTKILRSDEVKFHNQTVKLEDKIYILMNKPKGYVTTSEDPLDRKTVMDLVKNACPERIYPIGRLDSNTTGVLMLTNDGDMASKLMHPKFQKKKIYHVFLNKNVSVADLKQIMDGIELEDGVIRADAVDYASETDRKQVGIEIHSGRNRIVRRIFEYLGYKVMKLDRVYFAGLTKKNLRRGEWRFLTPDEVRILRMGAYE